MKVKGTYKYGNEEVPMYSWLDRLKYARSRGWYYKKSFRAWGYKVYYPGVPDNWSIYIDFIVRDLQQKNKKEAFEKAKQKKK